MSTRRFGDPPSYASNFAEGLTASWTKEETVPWRHSEEEVSPGKQAAAKLHGHLCHFSSVLYHFRGLASEVPLPDPAQTKKNTEKTERPRMGHMELSVGNLTGAVSCIRNLKP